MKINQILIINLILGLLLTQGCEKEGFYYQDEARIKMEGPYKWAVGTDSLEFSFVTTPSSVEQIDLEISLLIMGNTSASDRIVNLKVVDEKTTASISQYAFPDQVTIPANESSSVFRVTLKRTPDLQEKTVRLFIQVVDSDDFKVGVRERSHILIKWNDILSMPSNWDTLIEFFGQFSLVKYRFILETTGVTEFDTTTMSWAQLMNYKIILKNALDEYNAANPANPLTDENGQIVTF